VDLLGSWSSLGGPMARLEAGAKVTPWLAVYGFGEATSRETRVGGGVRIAK